MTNPVLNQQTWRARLDDNDEANATWVTAAATTYTQTTDENFRIRFLIQETAGGMANNAVLRLQRSLNNGAWVGVSANDTAVVLVSSEQYGALSDSTQQLGAGTYITDNDCMAQGPTVSAVGGNPLDFDSNEAETEWCLQVASTGVNDGDNIQLRITADDAVLGTYTATANFTVFEAATNIEGSLLGDIEDFAEFEGLLTYLLFGSLFSEADDIFHGLVKRFVTPGNLGRHGIGPHPLRLVMPDITAAGATDIEGSLLSDADNVYHGLITIDITGSLLSNANTLYNGLITEDIAGSILEDADTLYHGQLDLNLQGSLFSEADNLYHGLVEPINIPGSLLSDADNIYHGLITVDIAGSLLSDTDNLYHGEVSIDIAGSLLSDSDILYHGQLDLGLFGSLLSDDDNLYHGAVSPQNLFSSLLQDDDTLYHGEVAVAAAAGGTKKIIFWI